ncbi:hypothetical protein GLOIN_2v1788400 [Rhizophagus irregularis DAOM 181602=DAOM 197198]|nr:hypothetical protein GLOIN_2v1788400 [Rhizophagus irregularis DAOM 181602=DAOM 197198]
MDTESIVFHYFLRDAGLPDESDLQALNKENVCGLDFINFTRLAKLIENIVLAVHDQQICIRQLQYQFKNYVKRLKAKHDEEKFSTISVPSSEWIRLQFWPKNIYTKTAIQYSGRFNISYKVQSRLLRKSHPDAHYCAALFHYTSLFAIKSRNFTCFISADDKHKVPIGETVEISTGVRNKATLEFTDMELTSCDPDFTGFIIM